jgi:hypothetical protein
MNRQALSGHNTRVVFHPEQQSHHRAGEQQEQPAKRSGVIDGRKRKNTNYIIYIFPIVPKK